MKTFPVIAIIILTVSCISSDESEALKAYYAVKQYNMLFPYDFVIDTRSKDNNGKHLIRSIRFSDSIGQSYLIYPFDSIANEKFIKMHNIDATVISELSNKLFEIQYATNATEITKNTKLGNFVYFAFEDKAEQLIFCINKKDIVNTKWKQYIEVAKKLDEQWYLVNRGR